MKISFRDVFASSNMITAKVEFRDISIPQFEKYRALSEILISLVSKGKISFFERMALVAQIAEVISKK
jgi:predicted HTH domain antitoxin